MSPLPFPIGEGTWGSCFSWVTYHALISPPPAGTPPFISFAYMYFVIWIQFIVKKDTKPALVGQNKVHPSLSCQAGNVYRQVLSELLLPYMCKINLFKQFLSLPSSALSWVFFFARTSLSFLCSSQFQLCLFCKDTLSFLYLKNLCKPVYVAKPEVLHSVIDKFVFS